MRTYLGEILALAWKDINFKHKTISINKSYEYHGHRIKSTKTLASNRIIEVNADLLNCLKQLQANHTDYGFKNNQNTIPSFVQ